MSDDDLPPGFVLGAPPTSGASDDLPPGFVAGAPPPKKFGLEDTWPARLAKSIYSAVTLPGDVMQGNVPITGDDGHISPQVISGAADLASLATPMSPAARLGVGWAGALKTKAGPAPTQEALDSSASALYDKARNLGVDLPASNISGFADKTAGELLDKHGITPEQAPNTYATLDRLRNAPDDSVVTVPNLDALRQNFGGTAGNFNNPRDQFAAILAKRRLADHVASLTDQDAIRGPASEVGAITREANGNYAAARRSEQISDSLNKAELQTAATHSGRNLDNKTRQAFVKILTDDKAGAGFAQPELDQAEDIIRGSKSADLMRSAGNFLGGGGGMGMLHGSSAGAAVGASVGGPVGAAIGAVIPPTVGYALKKGADASTLSKVQAFQEMVRRRSPLGASMPATVANPVSPKQAFMARLIANGFKPPQQPVPGESVSEKFKRELLLRSALATQNAARN